MTVERNAESVFQKALRGGALTESEVAQMRAHGFGWNSSDGWFFPYCAWCDRAIQPEDHAWKEGRSWHADCMTAQDVCPTCGARSDGKVGGE